MRYWYYHEAGQQKGPLPEAEFKKLFESGTLAANTLVWSTGMNEWQEARTVDNLVPPSFAPPPSPVYNSVAPPLLHHFNPTGPQLRPWIRYWARMIDEILFGCLSGVILAFIYPSALKMADLLLGMITSFLYVFIEPCMLSSWGTTPGKALLNIRLRKNNGTKLNYQEALSRSVNVWIRGLGFCIPIVGLFTQITAYNRLTRIGMTSWDRDGGFQVSHKFVGTWRVIVVIALFVGFCFLMGLNS